jgi:ferric-dicitrate binding protein FerR (iron transport regulator)
MQHPFDALLFLEDTSPEQRAALREALDNDPDLAAAFAHWRQVQSAVRDRLVTDLPEHRLLVLYALDRAGYREAFSAGERRALDAARHNLEDALRAHPGLVDVVDDVEDACADFEAIWATHATAEPDGAHRDRPARRRGPRGAPPRGAGDRSAAPPSRTVSRWGWRIGATVAVVLFAAVAVLLFQRDRSLTTLEVADGETQVVTLADGSTVRVLGGSALTYADPDEAPAFNRRVRLEGRAFFEVVTGQQGFTVEAPTGVTTVLGTSFGIQADDAAMDVVLASGRISVASRSAPEQVVVLEPGQQSRVARNALPTTPASVELTEALEWTGLLIFRATSLQDVARRLSAQHDVSVAVAPPLADERVTGTFEQAQPLAQVLDVLATTVNAEVRGDAERGYTLAPAP